MSDEHEGPCGKYCAVVDECEARGKEIERLREHIERLTQQLSGVCAVATEGFEIVAGKRQCIDNLMSHADVAEYALRLIKGLTK